MVSFLDKLVSLSLELISLEHSVWILVMKGELDVLELLVTMSREDQGRGRHELQAGRRKGWSQN